jgi:hypothetical protein
MANVTVRFMGKPEGEQKAPDDGASVVSPVENVSPYASDQTPLETPGTDITIPLTSGQRELNALREGGFTDGEMADHMNRQSQMLLEGGFTPNEIEKHWGRTAPSGKDTDKVVHKAFAERNPDDHKKISEDPLELVKLGFQTSSGGIFATGKKPDKILPKDATLFQTLLHTLGVAAGDMPAAIAGAIGGGEAGLLAGGAVAGPPGAIVGGILGAGAGAAGLPAILREAMLTYYDRGEISTFSEFAARLGASLLTIGKQTAAGTVAAPAGVIGGKLAAPFVGKIGAAATNDVTNAIVFTAAAGALDGHVPDMKDFQAGAIFALGMRGAMVASAKLKPGEQPPMTDAGSRVSNNLKQIYLETGIPPWRAVELAANDPVLKSEMLSQDAMGRPVMDKFREIAPPEPEPLVASKVIGDERGVIPKGTYSRIDWDRWAKKPKEVVTRINPKDGSLSSDPAAIADYLQDFGREAGFRFRVGPNQGSRNDRWVPGPSMREERNVRVVTRGGKEEMQEFGDRRHQVWMPDTPDAQLREWYGLGRSEVLFHEAGHALDSLLFKGGRGVTEEISPALRKELEEISRRFKPKLWSDIPTHTAKADELMADGIAVWLSNPSERQHMPQFAALYGKRLEPYKKIVERTLPKRVEDGTWETPDGEPIKDNYFPYLDPKPEPAGASGGSGGSGKPPPPTIPPEFRPPPRPPRVEGYTLKLTTDEILQKWSDKIGEAARPESEFGLARIYRDLVSELGAARNVDKLLKEQGYDSEKLVGVEDMLRQTYGSAARATHFIRYGVLEPVGPNGAPRKTSDASFQSAANLVKEAGGNLDHWTKYMLARRTIDKAGQGVDTGFSLDEAKAVVKDLDKLYRKPTTEFNKVTRGVLDYGRDSGLFSQKQVDAMIEANPAYVSFRRLLGDTADPTAQRGGRGFRARNPLRRMEGDDGRIIDPILATMDNIQQVVKMSDRNRAVGVIVTLAEQHGISPLLGLKRLPMPEAAGEIAGPGSEKFSKYWDTPDGNPPVGTYEPFLAKRAQNFGKMGDNDFLYYRNGKAERWTVTDPALAKLLRGIETPHEAMAVTKIFETAAALQRAGIVGNPAFPVATGLRDSIGAWIADPLHPPPFAQMIRGFMPVMKTDAKFQEWLASGGAGSALASLDINYLSRDMHSIFEETGTWGQLTNVAKHPMEAAQLLNERLDAMNRVGYFERAKAQGFDPLKAATASRKAYLDFAEPGASAVLKHYERMTPFLRPHILGLKQIGEAMKAHPFQTSAYAVAGITLPFMLSYAMNYVQDEYGDLPEHMKYRNLPRWQRDTMYILPVVNGVRLRLSGPPGLNVAFGGTAVRFLDWFAQNDPKAFDEWATTTLVAFLPPLVPTLATPIIETLTNRDTMTGRKVIPASLERAHGYMQYTENTSEIAKSLARVVGPNQLNIGDLSPLTVENWIRSTTGTVGMSALRLLNAPFNASGRPWEVSDIPFVASFTIRNPGASAQPIQDFFDEKVKMDKSLGDRRLAMRGLRVGRPGAEEEFNQAFNRQAAKLDSFATALRMQQSIIEGIHNNKEMNNAEKQRAVDTQYGTMIMLSKAGLQYVQALKEAGLRSSDNPETPIGAP